MPPVLHLQQQTMKPTERTLLVQTVSLCMTVLLCMTVTTLTTTTATSTTTVSTTITTTPTTTTPTDTTTTQTTTTTTPTTTSITPTTTTTTTTTTAPATTTTIPTTTATTTTTTTNAPTTTTTASTTTTPPTATTIPPTTTITTTTTPTAATTTTPPTATTIPPTTTITTTTDTTAATTTATTTTAPTATTTEATTTTPATTSTTPATTTTVPTTTTTPETTTTAPTTTTSTPTTTKSPTTFTTTATNTTTTPTTTMTTPTTNPTTSTTNPATTTTTPTTSTTTTTIPTTATATAATPTTTSDTAATPITTNTTAATLTNTMTAVISTGVSTVSTTEETTESTLTSAAEVTTVYATTAEPITTSQRDPFASSSYPLGKLVVNVPLSVKFDVEFHDNLLDNTSPQFKSAAQNYTQQLTWALNGTSGFKSVAIVRFWKGSVGVECKVKFEHTVVNNPTTFETEMKGDALDKLLKLPDVNGTYLNETFPLNLESAKQAITKAKQYPCSIDGACTPFFVCSYNHSAKTISCLSPCDRDNVVCRDGTCEVNVFGKPTCRCPAEGEYIYGGETCELKAEKLDLSSDHIIAIATGTGGGLVAILTIALIVTCCRQRSKKAIKETDSKSDFPNSTQNSMEMAEAQEPSWIPLRETPADDALVASHGGNGKLFHVMKDSQMLSGPRITPFGDQRHTNDKDIRGERSVPPYNDPPDMNRSPRDAPFRSSMYLPTTDRESDLPISASTPRASNPSTLDPSDVTAFPRERHRGDRGLDPYPDDSKPRSPRRDDPATDDPRRRSGHLDDPRRDRRTEDRDRNYSRRDPDRNYPGRDTDPDYPRRNPVRDQIYPRHDPASDYPKQAEHPRDQYRDDARRSVSRDDHKRYAASWDQWEKSEGRQVVRGDPAVWDFPDEVPQPRADHRPERAHSRREYPGGMQDWQPSSALGHVYDYVLDEQVET